ncbi:MAG: hypothetical protein H0U76_24775 [Ktedonobacteraceae bacterium]|nr:hypothetical protein [Ktedonobacteraceae bacterium]
MAKLREPAAFPGWFRRIIFKQADHLTRGKHLANRPLEDVVDLLMTDDDPTEVAEANETSEQVQRAIGIERYFGDIDRLLARVVAHSSTWASTTSRLSPACSDQPSLSSL